MLARDLQPGDRIALSCGDYDIDAVDVVGESIDLQVSARDGADPFDRMTFGALESVDAC